MVVIRLIGKLCKNKIFFNHTNDQRGLIFYICVKHFYFTKFKIALKLLMMSINDIAIVVFLHLNTCLTLRRVNIFF